jgi:hypothetical protein
MLHFTPHKRAYKAHREDKKVGGIGDDGVLSDQICSEAIEDP